jgi:hypothetical protein
MKISELTEKLAHIYISFTQQIKFMVIRMSPNSNIHRINWQIYILAGNWACKYGVFYCAAKRALEGGRNLEYKHWVRLNLDIP